MAIRLDQKTKYIPLEMQCEPEKFKKEYNSKKGNPIKDFCEASRESAGDILTEMRRRGITINLDNFLSYFYQGGVDKIFTLDELFEEYLIIKKKEYEGGKITKITYDRYKLTKKLFYQYCGLKGGESVYYITIQHWRLFEAEMQKHYKPSYICGFQKKLKSIFQYAHDTGKINRLPFVKVKIDRGTQEIVYLTPEELSIIKQKTFNIERLNRVKDLFVFQCYTALAWADLKLVKKEDFHRNDKGIYILKGKRQKTGRDFVVYILPDAELILRKYDFSLPIISYDKYNKYLKEVGEMCDIDKPFSTHLARRTGACYLLNNGVDIEIVAKFLGDTPEMVRKHYAMLFDSTLENALTNLQQAEKEQLTREFLDILEGKCE